MTKHSNTYVRYIALLL